MLKLSVLNTEGKESENLEVPDGIFADRVNKDVLYQAVVMYQNCQRQGTVATKGHAFVSGGGKKPFKQKGTGRARQGSTRSPLWIGGGLVFGPQPRDLSYSIPQKIKRAALRESLNAKLKSNDLCCLNDLGEKFNKTKEFAKIIKQLGLQGKIIAILDGSDPSVERVSRNIPSFQLIRSQDVNAYDILKHKKVLVTKTGFNKLLERIGSTVEEKEEKPAPKKAKKKAKE